MSTDDEQYFMLHGRFGKIEVASFKLHHWAFSKFYHLELTLNTSSLPFQLNEPACLKFEQQQFHAVVQGIQQSISSDKINIQLISPTSAALQGRHSRVYSQLTKEQLLTHFLQDAGLNHNLDFKLMLNPEDRLYFFHQENEPDIAFFNRLMAYWGLIFFEQQQDAGTILLISEKLDKLPAVRERTVMANHPKGMNLPKAIHQLQLEKTMGSAKLETLLYSPEKAAVERSQSVSGFDFCRGSRSIFGALADGSSEWMQGQLDQEIDRLYFQSQIEPFSPAQPVKYLTEDGTEEFYWVESVLIEGLQDPAEGSVPTEDQTEFHQSRLNYHGHLTKRLCPVAVFSPEERTLNTLKTAHVESQQDIYADISEQSSYLVRLLADQNYQGQQSNFQNPNGSASLRQRNAQYYAGNEYGLCFPLHKKTEIITVNFNADEQQSGILGAMINRESPSLVTGQNANQQLIRTHHGAEMLFFADAKDKSFSLRSAEGHHQFQMLQGETKTGISLSATSGDIRFTALKNLNMHTSAHLLMQSRQAQYHWVGGNIKLSSRQDVLSIKSEESMTQNWQENCSFHAQNQYWTCDKKIQLAASEQMRMDAAEQVRFIAKEGGNQWHIKHGNLCFKINKRLLLKVKNSFIAFSPSDIKISTQGVLTLNAERIEGIG